MGKYFGTDGVRGVAGTELTSELAYRVGLCAGYVFKEDKKRPLVLIGKDTRISGDMIENALSTALNALGVDVIRLGVIPTPAVAYLVKKYNADIGIMVSASHNPFEHNGIKIFKGDGYKLADEKEEEIEKLMDNKDFVFPLAKNENIGITTSKDECIDDYVEHICSCINGNLKGIKIVVDCANGSSSVCAEKIFGKLGTDTIIINDKPNGININKDCGSTHLENLSEKVKEEKAMIGVAFDGDADRCLCVDENGEIIDGDKLIAVMALEMKKNNQLNNNFVAVTILSNLGFFKFADNNGIKYEKTNVGDRYVLEKMIEKDIKIGGEQSGHIILSDYATTGDGELSAVKILEILKKNNKPFSELASVMNRYPQVMINVTVKKEAKTLWENDKDIKKAIELAEEKLCGDGRIIVRPSGTEPLIRVMIEGQDHDFIEILANDIADVIRTKYSI